MLHGSTKCDKPIWIHWGNDPFCEEKIDLAYYGFPEWEKEGYIKSATHHPLGDLERGVDPMVRAKQIEEGTEAPVEKQKFEMMINFLKRMIPAEYIDLNLSFEEIIAQKDCVTTCLYEMTPTEDFIIDYIPTKSGNKNVVMFGGKFSVTVLFIICFRWKWTWI